MQLNTFLKLGSLAFNVAQDEKVRELAGLIHNGAKRRGVFAPWPGQVQSLPGGTSGSADSAGAPAAMQSKAPSALVPFAPQKSSPAVKQPTPGQPETHVPAPPSPLSKYLTAENAKKALNMAGQVANMLIK